MRYDAFISYRHADLDLYIAKRIHKGLETLKVPRAVAKKSGKKSIKRVFRDQEELPIGSDLGDNIESALAESEYLLVICSPRTPESYWVQKEISTFIQMHGREHVLAVLIEGEPEQAFPRQLLTDDEGNPVEPLAADVRGNSRQEVNKKLKTEILRLAAPLLHCSYDDLRQRHRERKMKQIAALMGVVAALGLLFGAYSTYNAALIQQNLEGKQRNQSKYLADTSLRLLEEGNRRAAVLVALEALPSLENDRPYVAEAQYALSQALYCYDTGNKIKMDRTLQHELPVQDFYFNQEGTRVASIDQGGTVYVWNVDNGERLAQISPKISELGYIEYPIAAMVYEDHVITCENKVLRSLNLEGQEEWTVERPEGTTYCEFDEDKKVAVCIRNEEVVFYDITNGKVMGSMVNGVENSYTGKTAFNGDKTRFAISHLREEGKPGYVSVYDFETQKVTDVEVRPEYISDIAFTAEDDLVVTQSEESYDEIMGMGHIQKIDWKEGKVLWQDSYAYQILGYEATDSQVKCRNYIDQITGEAHNEILMSVDNVAYTWDGTTGEQLAEVTVDSGIVTFLISTNTKYGFLAQSNGTIDIVDMTSGFRNSASAIETAKAMKDLSIKNGVAVFRSYASPDLTVMKYPKEADTIELDGYEADIKNIDSSKDETYYAVNLYDFNATSNVRFYETKENQFVGEWIEQEGVSVEASGFVDDGVYMLALHDGTIIFFDVETGEKETLSTGEDFQISEYDVNKDMSFALIYEGDQFGWIDLRQKKMLSVGKTGEYLYGAIISEDGKRAYCSTEESGVCILDLKTGELTPIELSGYQVLSTIKTQDAFAVSNDSSLLAVSCRDGMLRVLDVEKLETVAEFPFVGVNRRFIEFTADNTQIMLQGDDYYFRVYDLERNEFSYISTEQYNEIDEAVIDEKTGTLSLITSADMLILNLSDYERVASIEGGKIYLPKSGVIISKEYQTLYQFPYRTLEMLQQEAREQFGEDELTELERIKYHVE